MSSNEILPKETQSATGSPTGTLPPYTSMLESHVRLHTAEHNVVAVDTTLVGPQPKSRGPVTICSQDNLVWIEDSIAATDVILAALGPLRYHLSFRDACLCGLIGLTLGTLPVAFVSAFGPKTGHRTAMLNALVMGRMPAKVITVLNVITRLGGMIIEMIVAGQILSAIIALEIFSTSVAIILASATLAAAFVVLDNKKLNFCYAVFPQILIMFILASVVDYSKHSSATLSLSLVRVQDKLLFDRRFSFASLCMARTMAYAPFATQGTKSDDMSNRNTLIFVQSILTGLPGFCYTLVIGVVMGEMVDVVAAWQEAYAKSPGSVLTRILQPTGMMLTISCAVVLVIGTMLRTTKFLHSIVANLHDLNSRLQTVPTPIYPTILIPVCGSFAVLAKDHLIEVMVSTISITGYLTSIWFAILFVEYVLFNRFLSSCDKWLLEEHKRPYPFGLASSATLLLGCTVVVLCMTQTWYVGPIAHVLKHPGLDVSSSHSGYRSNADFSYISSRLWLDSWSPSLCIQSFDTSR
jgi:purine-cytosine permease-like protein